MGALGVIFERSRRSTLVLGITALTLTLASAATAVYVALGETLYAASIAFVVAAMALGFGAARTLLKLRGWPPGRIGFFRDRLVLLDHNTEQHIPWDRIEIATLGSATGWTSGRTSLISVTDRLTLRMTRWRGPSTIAFRPSDFGVDPVSCRDLVLQARDDRDARARLPEFDSLLDLTARATAAGELISPRL